MSDGDDYRKWLNDRLGEPAPARGDEYARIRAAVARRDARPRERELGLWDWAACFAAIALALAVILLARPTALTNEPRGAAMEGLLEFAYFLDQTKGGAGSSGL